MKTETALPQRTGPDETYPDCRQRPGSVQSNSEGVDGDAARCIFCIRCGERYFRSAERPTEYKHRQFQPPAGNGLLVVERLRSLSGLKWTPIIMIAECEARLEAEHAL